MANQTTPSQVPNASYPGDVDPALRVRAQRYAYCMVGHEADSEEIVQEAFCRLAEKNYLMRAASDGRLAALLFTTVRNLSIDLLRKNKRRKQVPLASAQELADRSSDATGELDRLNADLALCIDELPGKWAEALKLRVAGELSYDEISRVLQCSLPQVRTWIHRARKQLAAELTRRGWMKRVR